MTMLQIVTEDEKCRLCDFGAIEPMIQSAKGLTLGQVCALCELEGSTVQNWVKRGFVAHPVNKMYKERQVARILLISALRSCMKIDDIGDIMRAINGDADDTEDDIISEKELYRHFRSAVIEAMNGSVEASVKNVLADYDGKNEKDVKKLEYALCTMVFAYFSSLLKSSAEKNYETLKSI